jgi:hypothetical protein
MSTSICEFYKATEIMYSQYALEFATEAFEENQ